MIISISMLQNDIHYQTLGLFNNGNFFCDSLRAANPNERKLFSKQLNRKLSLHNSYLVTIVVNLGTNAQNI